MNSRHWFAGMGVVLLAGLMQAGFPLPMKYTRRWRWENIWLTSSLFGLLVFPWILAAVTIPDLKAVLAECPIEPMLLVLLFGAGWGVGGLLFGLGVHRVGLGLTLCIVIGLTSALGSLVPMALFHPGRLHDRVGILLLVSVAVTLIGLIFCTVAGVYREGGLTEAATFRRGSYAAGVIICVISGVLSPLFNFALICGGPLIKVAIAHGGAVAYAPNLIWAVAMTGGMLPTAIYCGHALRRNHTWKQFYGPCQGYEWLLAATMGALFAVGNSAYGVGAEWLGSFGPILGWPIFMAMQVVAGNVLGFLTGEWSKSSGHAFRYLVAGNLSLIIAIFMIAPSGS